MTDGIVHLATGSQTRVLAEALYREGTMVEDDPATRSREASRRLGPRPSRPGGSSAGHRGGVVPSRAGVAGHD